MRVLTIAAGLALLAAGPAAAAGSCTDVAPDASGRIVVRAAIPDTLPRCYAFAAKAGQKASIAVSTEDQMGFGVQAVHRDGSTRLLGDDRHSQAITTEDATYQVLVGSAAPHGNTAHEFTLTITLQ